MNLRHRVSNTLPYVVLTLGFLFSVSPFVPFGKIDFVFLVPISPSYVVAGAFAWLYTRGKVKKDSYLLAVPTATLVILTVMFGLYFIFSSTGPYTLATHVWVVLVYGIISLFYVLGHEAGKGNWVYVGASVLVYLICVFAVILIRVEVGTWVTLLVAGILALTLGAGTPLAVVAYVVSSRNQSGS